MAAHSAQDVTLESIRSVPLFASLDEDAVRQLRSLLRLRIVAANTTLFRAGDPGDGMYLIEAGRIRITLHRRDETITLADLAQGDFFGEMAILDGEPRSAEATVIEDARLAVLSRQDFLELIQRNPLVAAEMLTATFSRLRRTDRLVQERVARNVNEEEKKQLTFADRAADVLADFGGSWKFIGLAVIVLFGWMFANTALLVNSGFDPFPYTLLNLVLAIVTGIQAPIIMMSQNRQSHKDRLRADLDYQLNLKNELALTELLRRMDLLESERLPLLFEEQWGRLTGGGRDPQTPSDPRLQPGSISDMKQHPPR
jgi:uncharacterized membrane protein